MRKWGDASCGCEPLRRRSRPARRVAKKRHRKSGVTSVHAGEVRHDGKTIEMGGGGASKNDRTIAKTHQAANEPTKGLHRSDRGGEIRASTTNSIPRMRMRVNGCDASGIVFERSVPVWQNDRILPWYSGEGNVVSYSRVPIDAPRFPSGCLWQFAGTLRICFASHLRFAPVASLRSTPLSDPIFALRAAPMPLPTVRSFSIRFF